MAQPIKYLPLGLVLAFAPALAFAQVALPKSSINNAQPVFCVNPSTMVTNSCSGSATVAVNPVTTTSTAGTVATGGTFQSVLASNGSRNGCLIQNPISATETLFVFFGANGSATTGASIALGAGSAVSCAVGGLAVATDNISVTATTTSHAFVVTSQ